MARASAALAGVREVESVEYGEAEDLFRVTFRGDACLAHELEAAVRGSVVFPRARKLLSLVRRMIPRRT